MKLLIVHNNYGKYSGEEAVVDKMGEMFTSHGNEVCYFRMSSQNYRDSFFGKIQGFISGIYSRKGVIGLRNILAKEKPDVVNVHNLYPFISPAALFECTKAGIPVIMTVHNFRLICPTGLFMRKGNPCETCLLKGNEWSCIKYNCERSLIKSIGYTLRNVYARRNGSFIKNIDRYACITNFQKNKLIQAGFDPNKIVVIPNSIDVPDSYVKSTGNYVAYIGRLSYEKGYDLLLKVAEKHPEINFRFAGAIRDNIYQNIPNNVNLVGYLNKQQLIDFIQQSKFIVVPSRCYEGFPMAILESACLGKPAIGPDHGGFSEIIGTGANAIGRLFIPGNLTDMEEQIINLWNNDKLVRELGDKAFEKIKREFSSNVVYEKWRNLINEII